MNQVIRLFYIINISDLSLLKMLRMMMQDEHVIIVAVHVK